MKEEEIEERKIEILFCDSFNFTDLEDLGFRTRMGTRMGSLSLRISYGGFSVPSRESSRKDMLIPASATSSLPKIECELFLMTKTPLFSIIMVDPDAPSAAIPTFRSFNHWTVVNITTSATSEPNIFQLNLSTADTLVDYVGCGPPWESGRHRYIFMIFEQNVEFSANDVASERTALAGRGGFHPDEWFRSRGFSRVLNAHCFESEWDASVDALHAALGFIPPPEFQSPLQRDEASRLK